MLSVKARIDRREEKRKKRNKKKKKRQTEKKNSEIHFFLLFDGIEAVRHAANQLE